MSAGRFRAAPDCNRIGGEGRRRAPAGRTDACPCSRRMLDTGRGGGSPARSCGCCAHVAIDFAHPAPPCLTCQVEAHMVTWSHAHMVTWSHGHMVTWSHGHMVTWSHGHMLHAPFAPTCIVGLRQTWFCSTPSRRARGTPYRADPCYASFTGTGTEGWGLDTSGFQCGMGV